MGKQQFEVWKDEVLPVLNSKVEEFQLIGYDEASAEEVWECVLNKLRKQKEPMRIYQFVNEILKLKVTDYMTWLTIGAYQGPNWFEEEMRL